MPPAEDAASAALEAVRQCMIEIDRYIPILGDFLDVLTDWPEADHVRMYDLAEAYQGAAELYTNHLEELHDQIDRLSVWQGDGAAQIAHQQLQSYYMELSNTAEALSGVGQYVHSQALSMESMKWMTVVTLVMMAIALIQALIMIWTGVSAAYGAAAAAAARVTIQALARELLRQIWTQGIKAGLRKMVQTGFRGAAQRAVGGALAYAGFMAGIKGGIMGIQALQGHDPFVEGWERQFAIELGHSLIAGALGGPLTFGSGSRVVEALAFGAGQLGDNFLKMGLDRLFEATDTRAWAERNGLYSGMTLDDAMQAVMPVSLLSEMLEPGSRHGRVDSVTPAVNQGAQNLFNNLPAPAPAPAGANLGGNTPAPLLNPAASGMFGNTPAPAPVLAGAPGGTAAGPSTGAQGGPSTQTSTGPSTSTSGPSSTSNTSTSNTSTSNTSTSSRSGGDGGRGDQTTTAPPPGTNSPEPGGSTPPPADPTPERPTPADPTPATPTPGSPSPATPTPEPTPATDGPRPGEPVRATPATPTDGPTTTDPGPSRTTTDGPTTTDPGPTRTATDGPTTTDPGSTRTTDQSTSGDQNRTDTPAPVSTTDGPVEGSSQPPAAQTTSTPPADGPSTVDGPSATGAGSSTHTPSTTPATSGDGGGGGGGDPTGARPDTTATPDPAASPDPAESGDRADDRDEAATGAPPPVQADGGRSDTGQGARPEAGRGDQPGSGQRGSAREPRWWNWAQRIQQRIDMQYTQSAADLLSGAREGGPTGADGRSAPPLTPDLVQRALDTNPDSLNDYGRRMRSFIEEHFSEVGADGVRRPLDQVAIAVKLDSLRSPVATPASSSPPVPEPGSSGQPESSSSGSRDPDGNRPDGPRGEAARPDGPRGEAARPDGPRGEAARPDGPRGEAARPDGPRGEAARPDGPRGEAARPDGPRGEAARPDGPRGEAARPDGPRGEGARPDGGRGEGARPDGTRGEGARPDGTRGEGTRPDGTRSTPPESAVRPEGAPRSAPVPGSGPTPGSSPTPDSSTTPGSSPTPEGGSSPTPEGSASPTPESSDSGPETADAGAGQGGGEGGGGTPPAADGVPDPNDPHRNDVPRDHFGDLDPEQPGPLGDRYTEGVHDNYAGTREGFDDKELSTANQRAEEGRLVTRLPSHPRSGEGFKSLEAIERTGPEDPGRGVEYKEVGNDTKSAVSNQLRRALAKFRLQPDGTRNEGDVVLDGRATNLSRENAVAALEENVGRWLDTSSPPLGQIGKIEIYLGDGSRVVYQNGRITHVTDAGERVLSEWDASAGENGGSFVEPTPDATPEPDADGDSDPDGDGDGDTDGDGDDGGSGTPTSPTGPQTNPPPSAAPQPDPSSSPPPPGAVDTQTRTSTTDPRADGPRPEGDGRAPGASQSTRSSLLDRIRNRLSNLFNRSGVSPEVLRREATERAHYEANLRHAQQQAARVMEADPTVRQLRQDAAQATQHAHQARADAATHRADAGVARAEAQQARAQAQQLHQTADQMAAGPNRDAVRQHADALDRHADRREVDAQASEARSRLADQRATAADRVAAEANRQVDELTTQAATRHPNTWRYTNVDSEARYRMVDGDHPGPRVSRLTGRADVPPPVWDNRPYGQEGGLRRVLHADQARLERALSDGQGGFVRTPDPTGPWLQLLNAFGYHGDPTRTQNCNDSVASLYDTFVHGRPTVAAPRTYDGYTQGNPNVPWSGERDGPGRIEDLTGGRYQSLVGNVSQQTPAQAASRVDAGFDQIRQQLLAGGHGSFASIVTAWRGGGSHAWAALNYQGTIYFVDPQAGTVVAAVDGPNGTRYVDPHTGQDVGNPIHDRASISAMDALVVDGNARPMPFADRPAGIWNDRPLTPEYLATQSPEVRASHAANTDHQAARAERDQAAAEADRADQAQQREQQHARDADAARTRAQDAANRAANHHAQRDNTWRMAHQADQIAQRHSSYADQYAERARTGPPHEAQQAQQMADQHRGAAEQARQAADQHRAEAHRQEGLRRQAELEQQHAASRSSAADASRQAAANEARAADQAARSHEQRAAQLETRYGQHAADAANHHTARANQAANDAAHHTQQAAQRAPNDPVRQQEEARAQHHQRLADHHRQAANHYNGANHYQRSAEAHDARARQYDADAQRHRQHAAAEDMAARLQEQRRAVAEAQYRQAATVDQRVADGFRAQADQHAQARDAAAARAAQHRQQAQAADQAATAERAAADADRAQRNAFHDAAEAWLAQARQEQLFDPGAPAGRGAFQPENLPEPLRARYEALNDPRAQAQFARMYEGSRGDANLTRALDGMERGAQARGRTLEDALVDRYEQDAARQAARDAIQPPSPEVVAEIDAQLQLADQVRARIDAYAQAHPEVRGTERWQRALDAEVAALRAEREGLNNPTETRARDHGNNIRGVDGEIAFAERSSGVVEVGMPVSATTPDGPQSTDVDVVAEGGRVWQDAKNYNLFSVDSSTFDKLADQVRRQLEIIEYSGIRVDGQPPRLEWFFPRGVDPEVAAALEAIRITDPVTGAELPHRVTIIDGTAGTPDGSPDSPDSPDGSPDSPNGSPDGPDSPNGSPDSTSPEGSPDDGRLYSRETARTNQDVFLNGGDAPFTLEEVHRVAEILGIDLTGVDVHLITDPEEIRYLDYQGASAYTPVEAGGREIRLGPAAFADPESLAVTIAHEYKHVEQLRSGETVNTATRSALEDAAYAVEPAALERFRAHTEGGSDGTDGTVLDREGVRPGAEGRSAGLGDGAGGRDSRGHDPLGRDDQGTDDGTGGGVRDQGGAGERPDDASARTDRSDPGGSRPGPDQHDLTRRIGPPPGDQAGAGSPTGDRHGESPGETPGREPEPASGAVPELQPGLDFPTTGVPHPDAMPPMPNEVFQALRSEAESIAAEQLRYAEEFARTGDGKYWFAKVYHFVTMHELQMIDGGHYTYPIMKLQEVVAFHATYRTNLDAWLEGRTADVEPNWRHAFAAAEAAGGRWHALPTLEVMDALLPSMQAHIRFDLPRAIATVYETFYAPAGVDFEAFRADFDRMQPVFDQASAALRPEIAAQTFRGDPGQYALVQQHGFRFVFDVPRERLHAWERAADLVSLRQAGISDRAELQSRLEDYSRARHPFTSRGDFRIGGERVTDYDWNGQPPPRSPEPPEGAPGGRPTPPSGAPTPAAAPTPPADAPAPAGASAPPPGVPPTPPPPGDASVPPGEGAGDAARRPVRAPFRFEQFFDDPLWQAESTHFEQALGAYYFNDPQTVGAARTALGRLRDALIELTPRREGESEADFVQRVESVFFRDPDNDGTRTSAGQSLPDTTVDDLLARGNVRELVTAFYNAAYYNRGAGTLSEALLGVYDGGRWDAAEAAGLNRDEVEAMRRQLDENIWRELADPVDSRISPNAYRFARDPFGTGNVVMLSDTPRRDLIATTVSQLSRQSRADWAQDALAHTESHYEALGTPLGEFERRYVEHAVGQPLDPDTRLPWREGAVAHRHQETGPTAVWRRWMTDHGFVVVDGISATTTRMLTAAKFLGLSRVETERFLGALMGWMLPGRDHSLYEMIRGAQIAGFGHLELDGRRYSPVDLYRSLPGMDLHTLRTQVLPDGMLPHEARYLDHALDPDGFTETQHPRVRAIAERLFPQLRDGHVTDPDLADWLRTNGIDPTDADAVRALGERLSEAHVVALTVYTRHSHYLINNVIRTQLWTVGRLEPVVQARMAHKVQELVSNYLENLATGGKALPLPLALRPLLHQGEGHLDSRSPLDPVAQRWVDASQRVADAERRAEEHAAEGRRAEARQARAEAARAERELKAAWKEIDQRLGPVTERLFDEMRWHADMVYDAMLQLPTLGRPDAPVLAYRGDWLTPVHSPIYGSRLVPSGTAREFLSMSPQLEVAIRFMVENPASDRRVIAVYRLTGEQARDISVFSSFPEDQEAVMPPRSTTRQVHDPELAERVRADVLAVAEDMVRRNVIPAVPERFQVVVIEEDPRGR